MKRSSFFCAYVWKSGAAECRPYAIVESFFQTKSHPLQGNGWRRCKAPYFLLISLEYLAKYTVRIKKHSTLGT